MAKKKGGPGRVEIPIDWEKVDASLVAGSLGTEVAAMLGIHKDTLYDRCERDKGMLFSVYSAVKRQKGDDMLRAAQFKNALEGNTTMQIWLGKNRLRQRDIPEEESQKEKEHKDLMKKIAEHINVKSDGS